MQQDSANLDDEFFKKLFKQCIFHYTFETEFNYDGHIFISHGARVLFDFDISRNILRHSERVIGLLREAGLYPADGVRNYSVRKIFNQEYGFDINTEVITILSRMLGPEKYFELK